MINRNDFYNFTPIDSFTRLHVLQKDGWSEHEAIYIKGAFIAYLEDWIRMMIYSKSILSDLLDIDHDDYDYLIQKTQEGITPEGYSIVDLDNKRYIIDYSQSNVVSKNEIRRIKQ